MEQKYTSTSKPVAPDDNPGRACKALEEKFSVIQDFETFKTKHADTSLKELIKELEILLHVPQIHDYEKAERSVDKRGKTKNVISTRELDVTKSLDWEEKVADDIDKAKDEDLVNEFLTKLPQLIDSLRQETRKQHDSAKLSVNAATGALAGIRREKNRQERKYPATPRPKNDPQTPDEVKFENQKEYYGEFAKKTNERTKENGKLKFPLENITYNLEAEIIILVSGKARADGIALDPKIQKRINELLHDSKVSPENKKKLAEENEEIKKTTSEIPTDDDNAYTEDTSSESEEEKESDVQQPEPIKLKQKATLPLPSDPIAQSKENVPQELKPIATLAKPSDPIAQSKKGEEPNDDREQEEERKHLEKERQKAEKEKLLAEREKIRQRREEIKKTREEKDKLQLEKKQKDKLVEQKAIPASVSDHKAQSKESDVQQPEPIKLKQKATLPFPSDPIAQSKKGGDHNDDRENEEERKHLEREQQKAEREKLLAEREKIRQQKEKLKKAIEEKRRLQVEKEQKKATLLGKKEEINNKIQEKEKEKEKLEERRTQATREVLDFKPKPVPSGASEQQNNSAPANTSSESEGGSTSSATPPGGKIDVGATGNPELVKAIMTAEEENELATKRKPLPKIKKRESSLSETSEGDSISGITSAGKRVDVGATGNPEVLKALMPTEQPSPTPPKTSEGSSTSATIPAGGVSSGVIPAPAGSQPAPLAATTATTPISATSAATLIPGAVPAPVAVTTAATPATTPLSVPSSATRGTVAARTNRRIDTDEDEDAETLVDTASHTHDREPENRGERGRYKEYYFERSKTYHKSHDEGVKLITTPEGDQIPRPRARHNGQEIVGDHYTQFRSAAGLPQRSDSNQPFIIRLHNNHLAAEFLGTPNSEGYERDCRRVTMMNLINQTIPTEKNLLIYGTDIHMVAMGLVYGEYLRDKGVIENVSLDPARTNFAPEELEQAKTEARAYLRKIRKAQADPGGKQTPREKIKTAGFFQDAEERKEREEAEERNEPGRNLESESRERESSENEGDGNADSSPRHNSI